ncbi:MAG: hypothetical protein DMG30_06540 [Acidobacteria bacterium]|nr:MAG: hypothetical protein DMG30_06540 [Acidobacteriota bacterium]
MTGQALKLKQASAVLQVPPKELQNLVQFGVVKPKRSEGTYFFDANTLLKAKFAFCLKQSLGTPAARLSKWMDVFSASEERLKIENPTYVLFVYRVTSGEQPPMKLAVPFRALREQIEKRMSQLYLYKDLPRGRKRRGWKKEFLASLAEAAKDMGQTSEEEILNEVRTYRKKRRRMPEITVAAEG